jgi:hypothetical protein
MLQGSATTALMTREVERLANASGFAVRRLTFDLWRPAGLRAFSLATDMLRDGRKAKTIQVRLLDGDVEIGRCTALLTAQGDESPADPFSKQAGDDAPPETGSPPPAFAQKWSRYFQNVSVRLIEGALEKPGPAAAWMRLDVPMVEGEANTPLLQAVQAADFSSGVGQIVDMREWTFINPEISLYFFRPPEGDWILIRSRTRAGANGAGSGVLSHKLANTEQSADVLLVRIPESSRPRYRAGIGKPPPNTRLPLLVRAPRMSAIAAAPQRFQN